MDFLPDKEELTSLLFLRIPDTIVQGTCLLFRLRSCSKPQGSCLVWHCFLTEPPLTRLAYKSLRAQKIRAREFPFKWCNSI